jgi:hypothetical protein
MFIFTGISAGDNAIILIAVIVAVRAVSMPVDVICRIPKTRRE